MSHRGVVKLVSRINEARFVTKTERHTSLQAVVHLVVAWFVRFVNPDLTRRNMLANKKKSGCPKEGAMTMSFLPEAFFWTASF